jgi:anti-anti-sigma factor
MFCGHRRVHIQNWMARFPAMSAARNPRSHIRTERAGDRVTLLANGAIDHDSFAMWDRCVSDVLDARPISVTLDLAETTFLASSGLRLIVDLRHQLGVAGIEFALTNVPSRIGQLLQLTGLSDSRTEGPPATP